MTGVDDARASRQRPATPPAEDPGRALPEPDVAVPGQPATPPPEDPGQALPEPDVAVPGQPGAPPPEDPGRALPELDVCLTCSDEAVAARVVSVEGAEALVESGSGVERVALDLVAGARPGDVLLCHAGIALARLSTGAGADLGPGPPPRATLPPSEMQGHPEHPSNRLLLAPVDAAGRTAAAGTPRRTTEPVTPPSNRLLLGIASGSGGAPDVGESPGASA